MQSEDENSATLKNSPSDPIPSEDVDQSKGARPKIRNPKEAKRRRFVMKQAKSMSKPQLLESVCESEEAQTLLDHPPHKPLFGVRSYVHTFYEAMAMDQPQGYEDIEAYQMLPKRRRKEVICWRIALVTGLLFLVAGMAALLVGFLVPKRREVVDVQEDIQVVDRQDQAFNRDLDVCKVVGTVLFCVGGLVLTAELLALNWMLKAATEAAVEEVPMTTTTAAVDVKVPATEELTAVQPKRVDPADEVVMTNAGLCKIP